MFVWAPRWPMCGDVSFGDWTNSLLTIKEIEIFSKLLQSDTARALGGGVGWAHIQSGQPVLTAEERAVAENLLERAKTRR
jgi:hypothetical protein